MKPKRGWEKNETQIIWLSEILENCRPGWKSQSVVQGMYRTAASQGAAWHCTAVNTACSQGAEKNMVGGGIQTGQEDSKDVPPTLCWMMWVNSGVGWRIYQIQLELVLSWAAEWVWCSDRALQVSRQELCPSLLPPGHLVCFDVGCCLWHWTSIIVWVEY